MSGHEKHICGNIGCKEAFQYRNQRSRHRKKCLHTPVEKDFTPVDGGGYLCNKCGKTIQYQNKLSRHKLSCMKNVAVIEKVFPCKHCSKTFKYQSKLNEHARWHSHSMFRCESCERSFKRNDHLQKHQCRPKSAARPSKSSRIRGVTHEPERVSLVPLQDNVRHRNAVETDETLEDLPGVVCNNEQEDGEEEEHIITVIPSDENDHVDFSFINSNTSDDAIQQLSAELTVDEHNENADVFNSGMMKYKL